ncbi:polymeric immunoglobulin receptor-like [Conger conger]|uniref:polymeric immunoglobulin receptor-like n=1 Tax=Conger conger TaxID=82655 RepID=UPI002A5AFD88|nr:polymeric immunoglobulin receptor-like [Conger conger]
MRLAFVLSFLTGAYSVSVLGPERVISNTKGNVMVQCKYDESYTDHVKYWCKVNRLISCYKLVSTSEDTHSRITIRDNKTEGAFYITMTDLTKDDEGQYKCGIDIALGFDEQALVHVQVNEDSGADVCSPEVNTNDKEREDITQIRDDPSNRELVITIRNLTGNDTGLYYCGVKQSSSHKDNRVPVNLNVDAGQVMVCIMVCERIFEDGSQVGPIPASTAEKENRISKQKQEGSTYPTNHLKSPSMLVPLAVSFGVLLLLCCVAALIVCKIKRNVRPDVADKGGKPPAANEPTLQSPAANELTYEEVTNDRPMSEDSALEPSVCLYSVVDLQQRTRTPPADQVLYSTINTVPNEEREEVGSFAVGSVTLAGGCSECSTVVDFVLNLHQKGMIDVLAKFPSAYSVVVWGPGEERALVGDSLTVSCRYTNYVENVKYWSRDKWGKGSLVKSDGTTNDNRMTITDNKAVKVFTVTMKDLKEDDDGWYQCGISIPGWFVYDQTSVVHISVKKVQAPMYVINQTKGKVTVRCKYHKSYTDSVKYWCKGKLLLPCSTLVKTGGTDTHGKISIRDNKTEGTFYITMTDLTKDDEGQYKCGIEIPRALDEQVSVHVHVSEGDTMPDLWGPRNVSGMASSSQTITCQYAADYTKSVKYWCKDSGTDVCSPEVNTHDKERENRTQIRDDPSNREFVITIRNLTGNDTGLYYCGVKQSSSHKENRVPVNLNVDAVKAQVEPIPASTTENGIWSSINQEGSTHLTNHSDRKSPSMLVPLAVSFGVLLLLCCVAALIVCKIKRNTRPAVADKGEKPPAANEPTLLPPAANEPTYEEVTNDRPMSEDSALEPSVCLYSVVDLQQRTQTPPADQVLYSTINTAR